MTKDELIKRMILVEGAPQADRAAPMKIRRRGNNIVDNSEEHPSEEFDDFFDYEREFSDLTPARDTVYNDMEELASQSGATVNAPEESENNSFGYIIMEKIEDKADKTIKNNNIIVSIEQEEENNKVPFEFIRCNFTKEDGNRCKKQAKKGNEYCGIHKKYLAKNKN